jgi:hypothetical protein
VFPFVCRREVQLVGEVQDSAISHNLGEVRSQDAFHALDVPEHECIVPSLLQSMNCGRVTLLVAPDLKTALTDTGCCRGEFRSPHSDIASVGLRQYCSAE